MQLYLCLVIYYSEHFKTPEYSADSNAADSSNHRKRTFTSPLARHSKLRKEFLVRKDEKELLERPNRDIIEFKFPQTDWNIFNKQ